MSKITRNSILNFIEQYYGEFGEYPTLQQICKAVGLKSVSSVHNHLSRLKNQGLIEKFGSSYEIKKQSDISKVPVLGYIAAGAPIEVLEEEITTITVSDLPKSGDFFALIARGDSMVEEGILDGDTVVIKKQSSAQNGQTVVAVIDDNKTTLKKLYRENGKFKLQPANQTLLPIFRDEVEVRGIVWHVIRNLNNPENNSSDLIATREWKTLDLFAGVGGIRLGFEEAGFKTVFANDFEKNCKSTYDLNFPSSKLVVEDITKIKVDDLPEFDFLLGGFPCQAFSIAGHRKGFDDDRGRGNLFFDITRILEAKKPEGFLLENVKNLKSHDGGNTFKVIVESLNNLGYSIVHRVLNTMNYGNIPQNRERIYIVGFKDPSKASAFEFPNQIELNTSVSDLLEDTVDAKYYYNGKSLYEKLKNEVNEVNQIYQWRRQYVRKNKKGVCPTLTANMGMGGHNVPIIYDGTGIRKLTPRECFRLQGFPDSYKLPNIADSPLYKQAGNSVSVPVIKRIADAIMATL